ncbi:MAG: DUF1496 domain-containing protein [Yoonia sp.]|nr:DUF1496 domain-containing protein [Yoonia sp.]
MSDNEIKQVGPVDSTLQTSQIIEQSDAPAGEDTRALCWFNGSQYSTGAQICTGGKRLLCHHSGQWINAGNC